MPNDPAPTDQIATSWGLAARIGLFAGPMVAALVYLALPDGQDLLSHAGKATAAIGMLMAIWWMTEAVPLEATSLLPLVLLPLLGVYTDYAQVGDRVRIKGPGGLAGKVVAIEELNGSKAATIEFASPSAKPTQAYPLDKLEKEAAFQRAATPYANASIFLFLGGFLIALAVERWGLHRRVALLTVLAVGTHPARIVGGFMLATAFISMWISNTATTLMMLPIGLSVVKLLGKQLGNSLSATTDDGDASSSPASREFATSLMLGIAYAASIGGLGTLIGTPPNVFFAGYMKQQGLEIGFGSWMLFAVPFLVVYLAICWWLLTKLLFPIPSVAMPGGRAVIRAQLTQLGPVSRGEWIVLVVFLCTATAWIAREPLLDWPWLVERLPVLLSVDDAWIAMFGAVALFLIPVYPQRGIFALDWQAASKLPWGVLLLFGGGLSLAAAMTDSNLAKWIGEQMHGLKHVPAPVLMVIVVAGVILFSELASNLATAATLLPLLFEVARGMDVDPLLLTIPAILAASCGFMLPVATPPNAIAFGTGYISMRQMVRAGFWLDLVAVGLIPLAVYALGGWALGIRW